MPVNNSKVWVADAHGDAYLATAKLIKGRSYFKAKLDIGDVIKRCAKWATYDVIY